MILSTEQLQQGVFRAGQILEAAYSRTQADLDILAEFLGRECDCKVGSFKVATPKKAERLSNNRLFELPEFKPAFSNPKKFLIRCNVVLSEKSRFGDAYGKPWIAWQICYANPQNQNVFEGYEYSGLPLSDSEEEEFKPEEWKKKGMIFWTESNRSWIGMFYTPWDAILHDLKIQEDAPFDLMLRDILEKCCMAKFFENPAWGKIIIPLQLKDGRYEIRSDGAQED